MMTMIHEFWTGFDIAMRNVIDGVSMEAVGYLFAWFLIISGLTGLILCLITFAEWWTSRREK